MLVRNPYGTNLDVIVNDEYLEFEELFSEAGERVLPPFFPQNSKPIPPNFNPGTVPPKPPMPGTPSNPNAVPAPPPTYSPNPSPATKSSNNLSKVSPTSLAPCKYQYVYVWQMNGVSYWAWFTNIDRTTASGYKWNGYRWVYFGVDLRKIDSFECYGRNEYPYLDNVLSNLKTQTLSPAEFKLEYPVLTNTTTEDAENTLNAEIIAALDGLLKNQVLIPEVVDFQKVKSAYEVPLDGYGLLSVVMSMTTLVAKEKRPRVTFDSLTVDLTTCKVYDFDDLFNPKTSYKEDISKLAMDIVKKLNYKLVAPYEGVTDNQKFYLTPIELVLYYQVDEYTPASQGLFRISIPYQVIKKYLSPTSPINKILNSSNIKTVPPSTEDKATPIPEAENSSAMGPEYLGTYTGKVPQK